jgi:hypothetical protein
MLLRKEWFWKKTPHFAVIDTFEKVACRRIFKTGASRVVMQRDW